MGWTAYYQILRERPLNKEEVGTLYDFIRRTNRKPWDGEYFGLSVTCHARPDHVLATGWQKFPLSDSSDDQERLLEVLTELSTLIDDVEVRVADDFETFGWDEEAGEAAMDGPTTELVAIEDYDAFVDPEKLVGVRQEPLPDAVDAFLEGEKPTRKTIAATLIEHANMSTQDPRRDALAKVIQSASPRLLVQAGLDAFDSLRGSSDTLQLMATAPLSPDDIASIVVDFLATWNDAHGVYWYDELARAIGETTLDALARVPAVEKEMRSYLQAARGEDESEMTYRCARAAATMLGRARSRHALFVLLETAREIRPMSDVFASGNRDQVMPDIVGALLHFDSPEIVPTLLLEVASGRTASHHRGAALVPLARLAPARVMQILDHLSVTGEATWKSIEALQIIGDDRAITALRRLCELPDVNDRARAAAALHALGVEPPALDDVPAPEVLVTHVSRSVRHAALRTLDDRADPATLLSFIAAAALDNAIAARVDTHLMSWKMQEMLSSHVRKLELAKQVAWLRGKGGTELPPQVIWPSVERVLADGPKAVALTYPLPWPAMDITWKSDVRDEERALIEALRSELDVAPPPPPPAPSIGSLFESTPQTLTPDVIDELITVIGKEQTPGTTLLERAHLPVGIARMGYSEAARNIAIGLNNDSLAALLPRLLARMPEIHAAMSMRDLCQGIFPRVIDQPGMPERLLEMWEQAFALPWEYKSRATTCLFTVASHPVIFARMIDEIAAPDDGPLRGRTSGALELLAEAVNRKADAHSAIVARLRRDRGRPRELAQWRGDAMRALRRLASEDGIPTAILELAEITSIDFASELFEQLAVFPSGLGALQQSVDLRNCARYAVRELCRSPLIGDESRHKYIAHPFWKLRFIAADKNPNSEQSKREIADVWAAVDAGGIPVTSDEERYDRPSGLAKATSAAMPLPPPRDGLASPCFDYRAWAMWAVDEMMDPADAAARVFADELDIALVERGHMRTAPRWAAWREKVPALPIDRRTRLAWARAQTDAAMPPLLARVRDEGARVVAAELPGPCLVLPPELRKELEDRERQVAEAGEALFTCT